MMKWIGSTLFWKKKGYFGWWKQVHDLIPPFILNCPFMIFLKSKSRYDTYLVKGWQSRPATVTRDRLRPGKATHTVRSIRSIRVIPHSAIDRSIHRHGYLHLLSSDSSPSLKNLHSPFNHLELVALPPSIHRSSRPSLTVAFTFLRRWTLSDMYASSGLVLPHPSFFTPPNPPSRSLHRELIMLVF